MAGWSEHVDEHKQRASFLHGLWKENGSPRHGPLAEVRKLTRAKFHYAVRMIKKSHDSIVSNEIARSLVSGNPKSFWDDVKKIKSNGSIIPNSVDNAKGSQ